MAIGTLGAIGLILAGGGAATSAYGQVKAGNAAKQLGDFNAAVAEAQAKDAIARGIDDEQRYRQQIRGLVAKNTAGFAGQNVDVGIGSPVDVAADAAFLGELDALEIRNNATREAWGYKVAAVNARMGGQNAAAAGKAGAVNTVLGTGGSLLMAKYGWGTK